MATQKQIEANRLNSCKSTGPRSAEGKARSSMNALKSGIDATSQVIRGETAGGLRSLQFEYYDRFHPTTPEQRMLVDTLIDAEWLLRRFRVCEAQLWERGVQSGRLTVNSCSVGEAFQIHSDYFARLQRRIDNAQKNYRNALRELQRLQAEETVDIEPDPAPLPDPPTLRNESVTLPNGFVPQSAPPAPRTSASRRHSPVDIENSIL